MKQEAMKPSVGEVWEWADKNVRLHLEPLEFCRAKPPWTRAEDWVTQQAAEVAKLAEYHRLPSGQVLAEIPGERVFEWWGVGTDEVHAWVNLVYALVQAFGRQQEREVHGA